MRTWLAFILKALGIAAAQVGVIGIGVWLDSTAMQWAGFVGLGVLGALIALLVVLNAIGTADQDEGGK